jgi:hypothetical protein
MYHFLSGDWVFVVDYTVLGKAFCGKNPFVIYTAILVFILKCSAFGFWKLHYLQFFFGFYFAAEDPINCEKLTGEDSVSTQDPDDVLSSPPATQRPLRLDMIPPPPSTNSNKRSSPLVRLHFFFPQKKGLIN